jgi:hypothetical protein
MQHRHPLHVALVDDRPVPRNVERLVEPPRERRVDDDGFRETGGVVVGRRLEILLGPADLVGEERIAPLDRPGDRLRVRIDEELRGVEALPLGRGVRSVDAVAVVLSRAHVGQIAVPDLVGALHHRNLLALDGVVGPLEQTELDRRRLLGEERKVDPFAVPRRPGGIRAARPDAH